MERSQIDFRDIVAALPGNYTVLNTRLEIIAASDDLLKAYRVKKEDAVGKSCLNVLFNSSAAAKVKQSIQLALRNKKEHIIVLQPGEWSPAEVDLEQAGLQVLHKPVVNDQGTVNFIIQQLRTAGDVHASRPTSTAPDLGITATQSQASTPVKDGDIPDLSVFNLPINELPIGIWLLDAKGTIIYANHAARQIWGGSKYVTQEQFGIYKAWWYNTGEPVQPGEFAAERALKKREAVVNDELKIQGFKGEWRIIRNTAVPLTGNLGELTGVMVVNQDITEQKKTDDARRASERKFKTIFENSMDSVLLTHPDGSIAMANAMTQELFGYTREELIKLGRPAVVDVNDPQVKQALEARKGTGRFRGELTGIRKDGTRFPIEVSSAVFKDEKGAEWTSMFIRDITERKNAEQERETLLTRIDEKKRWLEAVIERAPMGILLVKGEVSSAIQPNSWAKKMFGNDVRWEKGRDAVLGIVCEARTGRPLDFDELATSKSFKGETTSAIEQLLRFKDGTTIPVLVNSGPIKDAQGVIIGAVTIFQDISRQKQFEEAIGHTVQQLDAEKRWLLAVFEGSPLGMIMVKSQDPEHPIPNAYARRILGVHVDWSKGRNSYVGLVRNHKGKILSKEQLVTSRVLKGKTIVSEEQLIRLSDGSEIPVLAAGAPIYDSKGVMLGGVAFFQDITTIKELEKLREEWAAIIAHDLRQPITSIKLQAAMLKMLSEVSVKHKRIAEIIDANANQLNRMTHDLLEAAQLEAQKLKVDKLETDIVAFVKQVVERLQPLFPANKIILSTPPQVMLVSIDPGRIEQVIGNLISNASKYGLPGCEITVEVIIQANSLAIKITNPGKGIEAKDIGKLFQRFMRTASAKKGKAKGIGLGLYIAKGLVEAHGGRLYVESTPGITTTFIMELPAIQSENEN